MPTAPMGQKSLSLNKTEEAILKTVNTLRYASLEEIIRSHYSQGSRNHAREVLTKLSGGGDWQATGYLYRFPLPTTRGNSPRIFCLARRGALYLRRSGVPAHWYVRVDRVRNSSYGYLLHQLTVSRLLVALQGFYREHPEYQLTELLTCYDIAREPPVTVLSVARQDTTVVAIPDAWIYLERVADGKGVALWIEVDLASEQRRYFQEHLVSARIAIIKSGQYRAYFGTPVVLLCYVTTGKTPSTPESREARLHTLRRWTWEVLQTQKLTDWAAVFRFAAVEFETLYDQTHTLLAEPDMWYRPDSSDPVPLFDPHIPTHQGGNRC